MMLKNLSTKRAFVRFVNSADQWKYKALIYNPTYSRTGFELVLFVFGIWSFPIQNVVNMHLMM